MSFVADKTEPLDNYIYNVEGYSVNWTTLMDDLCNASSIYNEPEEDDTDLFHKLSQHLLPMPSMPLARRNLSNRFTRKQRNNYNRKTRHANMVHSKKSG
jgi:hypothetical protein